MSNQLMDAVRKTSDILTGKVFTDKLHEQNGVYGPALLGLANDVDTVVARMDALTAWVDEDGRSKINVPAATRAVFARIREIVATMDDVAENLRLRCEEVARESVERDKTLTSDLHGMSQLIDKEHLENSNRIALVATELQDLRRSIRTCEQLINALQNRLESHIERNQKRNHAIEVSVERLAEESREQQRAMQQSAARFQSSVLRRQTIRDRVEITFGAALIAVIGWLVWMTEFAR
jgi:uncharacterized protein YoxC